MDPSAIARVRSSIGQWNEDHLKEYIDHDWNIHRWITAYEGNEEETIKVNPPPSPLLSPLPHHHHSLKVLRRHLNNRNTMGLSHLPEIEPECPIMEKHAPLSILGRNHPDDNKVLYPLQLQCSLDYCR